MKLTFKDLKQQKFTIDAEPSDTIASVKQKISTEKGWEPAQQKLIYSGKILQDDNTIESYKIEEKGFIVCMTSKPKAAPKPAAEPPSTPAHQSTAAATPVVPAAPAAGPPAGSAAQPPPTPSPAPAGDAQTFNDPSQLALGEQRAAAIASMEGMGFPRDQIDQAMRAAFFNPDRAVEYLLTGIPESAQREQRPAAASPRAAPAGATPAAAPAQAAAPTGGDEPVNLFEAAAQAGQGGRGGAGGAAGGARGMGDLAAALGGGEGAGAGGNTANLDFLRNNPQFQQLRQVVQQQPQMLEPILQQVAAGNPQLAQIITQNPEQFMQLLAEDGGDDDVALPPGAQQISVTEEEREAIERLCRLGFERNLAIQAYFACDKNEELAANFLFDQPDDEGDDGGA